MDYLVSNYQYILVESKIKFGYQFLSQIVMILILIIFSYFIYYFILNHEKNEKKNEIKPNKNLKNNDTNFNFNLNKEEYLIEEMNSTSLFLEESSLNNYFKNILYNEELLIINYHNENIDKNLSEWII